MIIDPLGEVDGTSWEQYCRKLLPLKYPDFQNVPAKYGGDLGIDGFVLNEGILFQCHCPDDPIEGALYESQRNKITKDIKKLIENIIEIDKLGVGKIKKWFYLTPKFDNKQLIVHCRKKEEKVKKAIPEYLDDNFRILIASIDYLQKEISTLYSSVLTKLEPYTFAPEDIENCDGDISDNIKRKFAKLVSDQNDLNQLVVDYTAFFEKGRIAFEKLLNDYPDIHRSIFRLKSSTEARVKTESLINSKPGGEFLKETLNEYKNAIEKDFGGMLSQAMIEEIAHVTIADWLGRCPLDFNKTYREQNES